MIRTENIKTLEINITGIILSKVQLKVCFEIGNSGRFYVSILHLNTCSDEITSTF